MHLRLLTIPLATALLLSTLGCAKKEELAPSVGIGSYKLDSKTITCQATAPAG